MSEPEKTYTQKLIDSLRMEAEICRGCAGYGGESSSDFFSAMALLGRKLEAAAAELERVAHYAKGMEALAVQHANTVIELRASMKPQTDGNAAMGLQPHEFPGGYSAWAENIQNPKKPTV